MDGNNVRLFLGALFMIVFTILISIPFGRWQEKCRERKGGELLSIRTNMNKIINVKRKQKFHKFRTANRVLRSNAHKHCLLFFLNRDWYIVAGDCLTVQPVPDGDMPIWFVPSNGPIFAKPHVTMPSILASVTSTQDGWEQLSNSAIASSVMQNNTPPIHRYNTLAEAQAAAYPCPVNPTDPVSYIVGGSKTDPTFYLVQTDQGVVAITGTTAGTSVYRRSCVMPTPATK
jgi:hypothetical protein